MHIPASRIAVQIFSLLVFAVSSVSAAEAYKVPRLADGKPDLQGVWTNASATPFERPSKFGTRRAYTKEEADAIEKEERGKVAADAAPTDPDEKQAAGALPPVGNYNLFWTDRGMTAAFIDGEYRTSVIIEPADGKIPAPKQRERRGRSMAERATGPADGPEQRGLGERCILSFGSSGGPPMLPTMYNSYYQIVQANDYVLILVEMVHDARIIRIGGKHSDGTVRPWMGDSIGHWEGDTLVVETKHFRPEQSFRGSSPNMVVTEYFTRVAKDMIKYRFTINDPDAFTAPFTGELPFTAVSDNVYEYACHEGNYALPGIMAAEREREKADAVKKK
jgi:hypothetical protein